MQEIVIADRIYRVEASQQENAVVVNGKIVKTGSSDLALELEKDGYEGVSIAK